jgi:hypothetical protein
VTIQNESTTTYIRDRMAARAFDVKSGCKSGTCDKVVCRKVVRVALHSYNDMYLLDAKKSGKHGADVYRGSNSPQHSSVASMEILLPRT